MAVLTRRGADDARRRAAQRIGWPLLDRAARRLLDAGAALCQPVGDLAGDALIRAPPEGFSNLAGEARSAANVGASWLRA